VENASLEERLALARAENAMYERKLEQVEKERQEMYLVMFKKGQQAAKMDEDVEHAMVWHID
jgi:hypothetical protein